MSMNRRGMPAAQLAREYGASLNEFANDVVNLLAQLDESVIAADPAERCRESCAAVWAAMVAAFDASSLTKPEREALTALTQVALLPVWKSHGANEPDMPALLEARAAHYLRHRDPASQIKTAANLVNSFMLRLGIAPTTQVSLGKSLTALFAHRMLGDTHRIDDVRAHHDIDLPLIAVFATLVSLHAEPVLRILRLV